MGLLHRSNVFNLVIPSVADGTRPAAQFGTLLAVGLNSYGAYTSLIAGSSVTDDVYEIWINVNSWQAPGQAQDGLVTIGLDPAGGTSFTDFISHLMCSDAGPYTASVSGAGGVWYRFPVFIKAGTSIGAKGSINNVAVAAPFAQVLLFCKPSRPDLLRVGSFVRTFGEDTANSRGTVITPGTTSEGAYTQLGSALAEPLWYWEWGFGTNDAVLNAAGIHVDIALGSAGSKKIACLNNWVGTTTSEGIVKHAQGRHFNGAIGDLVYGRAQSSGALNTQPSLIAYGVGG